VLAGMAIERRRTLVGARPPGLRRLPYRRLIGGGLAVVIASSRIGDGEPA
jgi:hypothetical protein